MLAVTDTGMGMEPRDAGADLRAVLHDQGDGKGTGLGLSTVFGIVQQSGGNIWVYSEPGKGTTFKVYLPRVDDEVDALDGPTPLRPTFAAQRPSCSSRTRSRCEPSSRVSCAGMGTSVLPAQHAGEALLVCERHGGTIDLLVTDVVMPQMSGPELAKRLGTTRPDMKVLCMSGYTDDSVVRHGILEGGVAFLQKPITPASLTRKVREVLDGGRLSTTPQASPSAGGGVTPK